MEDVFRRNVAREDASSELPRLVGTAIVQSILDAVRRVFMENILYPSILECSDQDGSAVAVMSYIDIITRTLEHGRLTELLVNFLMSEDNDDDDVFTASWGGTSRRAQEEEQEEPQKMITLSQLLDNAVIMEESLKELIAIIHARKSLGIDPVRYL